MINPSDKKLILDFEQTLEIVKSSTSIDRFEGSGDKRKRKEELLNDYTAFCEYYFPEYCFAPMGWFHKEHFPFIAENPNEIYLIQYSREFAKSTHGSLFLPMYLKAKGLLTGCIIGSHDERMAAGKLIDLQVNLAGNQRFINDYGEQKTYGDWASGEFKTKDGVAFYGFGKGQSPRGYKFKWNRPNFGAVDDLNDKRQLKNDDIANEDKAWVMEELKPALWIKRWWLLVLQNKFHDNTVTALIENDEEIESTAFRVDIMDKDGNSNWSENFTNEDVANLERTEGGGFTRERMNTPFEEGTIFKLEDMQNWIDVPPLKDYKNILIHYLDPSYTDSSTSDYKFWVLLAKDGLYYDIVKAWGARTNAKEMWEYAFEIDEWVGDQNTVEHAMEANFIQEAVHGKELKRVEEEQDRVLRCHMDYRSKGNKQQRIATMESIFTRGYIRFNKAEKDNAGMKLLRKQLLGFGGDGKINDDGPDALESAIFFIDKYGKRGRKRTRSGKMKKKNERAC